ncbi:MAG TPA: hypothetical protein VK750_02090 [Cytophagaceae bacterium]|jgi:hypothetical protein|nr:hypothetical protein [Cytophagaceae bacterium]
MGVSILVIGRHAEILATVLRLINQNKDWQAYGAETDEEAIALFQQRRYQIVLLGGGIEELSEQYLRTSFIGQDPEVVILQHYGGGSGLLTGEIMEALRKKK